MSKYENTRRKLNMQERIRKYEAAFKYIQNQRNRNPMTQVYKLPSAQRNWNTYVIFSNILPRELRNLNTLSTANVNRALASYKREINRNVNKYKTAGSKVRYSPTTRGYVWNHPGMKKQLVNILEHIRARPQRMERMKAAVKSAAKFGKNYKEAMERFNAMKHRGSY